MRVLVTGATGRIGKLLVRELRARGEEVRALVMPGEPEAELRDLGVEIVYGDIRQFDTLPPALRKVDAVYHLGALLPQGRANAEIFETNIKGTFNILEAIVQESVPVHRFVFASSDEVYPSLFPRYIPIDEDHPQAPYSVYGLSKAAGESLCALYHRTYGIPTVCPRFTLTLYPEEIVDPTGIVSSWFFVNGKIEALRKAVSQSPEVRRALEILEQLAQPREQLLISCDEEGPYEFGICHPKDVVHGLLLLLDKPEAVGEAFNLGPPSSFTYDEFVKYVSRKIGMPYVEAVLPLKPVRCRLSIDKARTRLGYSPFYDIFAMVDEAVQAQATR